MRINLDVPYSEHEKARRLGARWDMARRCWYIEDMDVVAPFLRWMPKHLTERHKPSKDVA